MSIDDQTKHFRIGVDIGGTFTDVVLFDTRSGQTSSLKLLTTHEDPLRALFSGVERLLKQCDAPLARVDRLMHGTTLATNALIERKGAPTALLTTEGFRDVLETGREMRYNLYTLSLEYPPPLVPREFRFGVRERISATSEILLPLSVESVNAAVEVAKSAGVISVAICFLHSYANPEHENRAAEIVRQSMPGTFITLSSQILPQIGEYARVSTTVANAYVHPLMSNYLARLKNGLEERGYRGVSGIIASNGGTVDIPFAMAAPAALIESGPAAGITAAARVATSLGVQDVLAFDMGGTTAKLCLVQGGEPHWTAELEVARTARFERGSGLPIALPSVDLIEIGAGGGSIAHVAEDNVLYVGPHSAGSMPGPACYGNGGEEATVTDAALVLGFLNPEYFSDGTMCLSPEKAHTAVGMVAQDLGCTVELAALRIFQAVAETMSNAARVHVSEKGYDVRNASLLTFGGAGPTHAWRIAELLGISEVIIPALPGVLSAFGCVIAPMRFDMMRTFVAGLDQIDLDQLRHLTDEMELEATRRLDSAAVSVGERHMTWSLDMKYLGQRYQINVPVANPPANAADITALRELFGQRYSAHYGREVAGQAIEIVTVRLVAQGRPYAGEQKAVGHSIRADTSRRNTRLVHFGEKAVETEILHRDTLSVGVSFEGPAIIEEAGSTIVVPPRAQCVVRDALHLSIRLHHSRPASEVGE